MIEQLADVLTLHVDVGLALHGAWNVKHSKAHVMMFLAALDRMVVGIVEPGPRAQTILEHFRAHPELSTQANCCRRMCVKCPALAFALFFPEVR